MWDGIDTSTIASWGAVAIAVGGSLGFLRRSKSRTILIALWTALPFIIVCAASVATSFDMRSIDWPMAIGFTAVFTMFLLPPWALLTLLPFNLVRRWRKINAGIDYGNDS